MLKKMAAVAALALTTALAAVPASAQSYDAFSSFNAGQGTGAFSYGSFDGTTFTDFTQSTDCIVSGVTCLRGATTSLPSVFKADGSQATAGTVILPSNLLVAHPGEFNDSVFFAFNAPTAGRYTYSAAFTQQDEKTNIASVGVTEFLFTAAGGLQLFNRTVLDASNPSFVLGYTDPLEAGDRVGYIIDKDGNYFNDSTGFSFAVSAVPEPASWAMMIVGFGVVGGTMRRRSASKAALA